MEWRKASEIIAELGTSKQTFYAKARELNPYLKDNIKVLSGVQHFNEEAIELLRKSLTMTSIEFVQYLESLKQVQETPYSVNTEYIQSLINQIDFLKEQVQVKDQQIAILQKQVENFQVLIKETVKTSENISLLLEGQIKKPPLLERFFGKK